MALAGRPILQRRDSSGSTPASCASTTRRSQLTEKSHYLGHGGHDFLVAVALPTVSGNDVRSARKLVDGGGMQDNLYILLFPAFGEGLG